MEWTGLQIFQSLENFGASWVVALVAKRARNRHGGEELHEVKGLGKFLVAGEWPHGTIEKVPAWL